jgi:hypothetical protein
MTHHEMFRAVPVVSHLQVTGPLPTGMGLVYGSL